MAKDQIEYDPAIYDIQAAFDPSKINPTDLGDPNIRAKLDQAIQAQERFANTLEKRFSQPNWFRVAAGFAKPQLGGFLASLGSANEALGAWQEQQRAIAPTIERMRAQIAAAQVPFEQAKKAASIAASAPGMQTAAQAAQIAGLVAGPGATTKAGTEQESARLNQLINSIAAGNDYVKLQAQYGKDLEPMLSQVKVQYPGLKIPTPAIEKPEDQIVAPPAGEAVAAPQAKAPAPQKLLGVPESLYAGLPVDQVLATRGKAIATRMEKADEQSKALGAAATASAPIFEQAKTVYELGSDPDLKPIFGIFAGKDPGAVLGRILESQDISSVLQNARKIIAPIGLKNRDALTKYQAFENALTGLHNSIINGFPNPTDRRSAIEGSVVSGVQDTQDAFLRSIARLGSESLAKFETNAAFQDFLRKKDADIYDWERSPEYVRVQKQAQERNSSLMKNPASREPPRFFEYGLSKAIKPSRKISANDFEAEAARRGLR